MNEVTPPALGPDPLEPTLHPNALEPIEEQPPLVSAASEAASEDFIYLADAPDSQAPAQDMLLAAAAALLANGQAQTPITLGLFGGPGSGKTSALGFLIETASAQAEAAGSRLIAVSIDAADAADEPDTHIAARIYDALTAQSDTGRAPSLAREAVASIRDVHAVARAAADRLAEMREHLETERRSLESVAGRRARLAETVLFETPGSRVDSYARAHRAKIEARLRAFGFDGDLVAVWKELVREMAERNPLEKVGACAQALWAYRGQGRFLVFAILFAVIAWGLGAAQASRAGWIGWMKGNGGGQIGALAAWIDAHASLIGTLEGLAVLIAVLCLVADVVRAARFLNPIFRGATFLKSDLDARRRDLDALLAHQTRRVDLVTREVEAQARRAEDAERRAEGPRAATSRSEELRAFYGDDDKTAQARSRFACEFLDSFERILVRDGATAPRILVALDGFEALPPERAVAVLQTAGRLVTRRGFAAVFALDEARSERAFGADASARLARLVQIPLQLEADSELTAEPGVESVATANGTPSSRFDAALSAKEIALLRALAPYAGRRPRDAKRFLNAYRLARVALGDADDRDAGAIAIAVLSAMRAFGADAAASAMSERQGDAALEVAARCGFPVTENALDRVQPVASRLCFRAEARLQGVSVPAPLANSSP